MEIMKKPKIKSIPYEDFIDNESLEKMVKELNEGGANVFVGVLDDLINWGRSNSLWPLTFATSCCGIEFMALGAARYDMARFGFEVARASPRQADMIMVCGTITNKMAPVLKRLYDQMADPKYVIAVGGCAVSGGPFRKVLSCGERSRQDSPGRCIYSRMPSPPGSILLRYDATATESEDREILRRSKPEREET